MPTTLSPDRALTALPPMAVMLLAPSRVRMSLSFTTVTSVTPTAALVPEAAMVPAASTVKSL